MRRDVKAKHRTIMELIIDKYSFWTIRRYRHLSKDFSNPLQYSIWCDTLCSASAHRTRKGYIVQGANIVSRGT
ncbi:hypothetical protein chiPu_0008387 [Chiloscyllium punctatum]|uniref:Uncharacterized protein n=1 Tax=Chiloscyllium punctatum TaxID=137246 RepID=A0A401SHX1_CHIPU|nr:hypothetical protein [Chiloscyllium punctatum]